MTNEEAAAYFKRHIDLYCVEGICREAEEMAIKALEQEPCEDVISRDELLKAINAWDKFGYTETGCFVREPKNDCVKYIHYDDVIKCITDMPPVIPQPKTGRWIREDAIFYRCSECGANAIVSNWSSVLSNYCPNCGAKMEVSG